MADPGIKVHIYGDYDNKDIEKAIRDLKTLREQTGFEKVGGALESLGGKMAAVGGALTKSITLPIIGIGAAAAASYVAVDSAMDNIAVTTGATGKELTGLQETFKSVASASASSIDDVSVVIGELNTRLGLTGGPLETVSAQMLDLARVTGTDVTTAARTVTRAMNDMGLSADEAGPFMDMLLVTSQETGITIDTLADKMAKFGSPLRQVGFSAEETAAMLGTFEKAGVNTDLVMGSLRISLGKMAKAGEQDLPAALARTIESIKNAGTAGEAAAIAVEMFGSRAGPDMAAAIREGRLEVGDLVAQLQNSEGALGRTAAAVEGPDEAMARLKNNAMLLGAELAAVLVPVFEKVVDIVGQVVDWFRNLDPGVQEMIVKFAAVAAAVGPVILILGKIVAGVGALISVLNPVTLIIAAVVAAIAAIGLGLKWLYDNTDWFREFWDDAWQRMEAVVEAVVSWFQETLWPTLKKVFGFIGRALGVLWEAYKTYWTFIFNIIKKVVAWIAEYVWPVVRAYYQKLGEIAKWLWENALQPAWNAIYAVIEKVVQFIGDYVVPFYKKYFQALGKIATWLWENAIQPAWNRIYGIIEKVVQFIGKYVVPFYKRYFGAIASVAKALWQNGIKPAFDRIRSVIKAVVDWVVNWLVPRWKLGFDRIKAVIESIWETAKEIRDKIAAVWTSIVDGVKGLAGRITSAASGIWDGIKNSFRNTINTIIGWWNNLSFSVPAIEFGPFKSPAVTLNTPDIPYLAMGGIVTSPTLAMIGEAGPEAVVPLSSGRGRSALGGSKHNITINAGVGDAREIGRTVVDSIRAYERANGRVFASAR